MISEPIRLKQQWQIFDISYRLAVIAFQIYWEGPILHKLTQTIHQKISQEQTPQNEPGLSTNHEQHELSEIVVLDSPPPPPRKGES